MSQLTKRVAKAGFTLIELMIVVAIIGILAAIAIPKFADLITKSKESAAKGSLGSVRSAVSIYYSDNEGIFPASAAATDLAGALTPGSKYLDTIPNIAIPKPGLHQNNSAVVTAIGDAGGWWYTGSNLGQVYVNCTHADSKTSKWTFW
ncbi:MAG: prepilin-type N-terminal cleavage/methylation domain-containing protein [Elusimicrobia bacterium]|nr:prepilin-type N-terminal cleavage/methylation domain-containing protein [Elusimicrobiota bacterium]